MQQHDRAEQPLTIGAVAERTGLAPSAIRFYEEKGLVRAARAASGHRQFDRATIRRLSFVLIAQQLGYRLEEIKDQLDTLPADAAPTAADWERLSVHRLRMSFARGVPALQPRRCRRSPRRRTPLPHGRPPGSAALTHRAR